MTQPGRPSVNWPFPLTAAEGEFARACVALVVVALLSLSAPAQADPPENYPFVAYDEGLRLARQQKKKIFLYFGREGCGWCDKTNKESFSDAGLRRTYIDHYILVYVDSESGRRLTLPNGERITEMALGERLNVFATPVFAYLEPDGKLIAKIAGVQSVKDFYGYDRYVHGGLYRSMDFRRFLAENR